MVQIPNDMVLHFQYPGIYKQLQDIQLTTLLAPFLGYQFKATGTGQAGQAGQTGQAKNRTTFSALGWVMIINCIDHMVKIVT